MCVIQLLLSAAAFAQTQVTGHVADVRGDDIIGANVTVKGPSNGTITDIDGNFTINVDSKMPHWQFRSSVIRLKR